MDQEALETTQKNILIVEDDNDIAQGMASILKKLGHTIGGIFAKAEDALLEIGSISPDLVLMDVVLAGVTDGIKAGQYIEDTMKIPVIYLTGYPDKAAILEKNGKVPLTKPFDAEELKNTIGAVFYIVSHREKIAKDASSKKISSQSSEVRENDDLGTSKGE